MSICRLSDHPSNGLDDRPFDLEQCSIFPDRERLVYQARKLKQTREAIQEKLEEYRQQYEQMEIRAIAAEAENTSLKLQKSNLETKLERSGKSIHSMTDQLSTYRRATTEKGASLERFQSKLSGIRKAMTKEVEKLRQSEKRLTQVLDDIWGKVTEFRSNALSKEEFLYAIDTIYSSSFSPKHTATLPSDLHQMESGDELLKGEEGVNSESPSDSPSPPPLPPKLISTTSVTQESQQVAGNEMKKVGRKPVVPPRKYSLPSGLSSSSMEYYSPNEGSSNKLPKSPHRRNARVSNPIHGLYGLSSSNVHVPTLFSNHKSHQYEEKPDSDSSDDFEQFVPPRRRKRYTSEHVPQTTTPHRSLERYVSSPIPVSHHESKEFPQSIKKSSPILTRRPAWFAKKMSYAAGDEERMSTEKKELRRQVRSRSLDDTSIAMLHKSLSDTHVLRKSVVDGGAESDDNTGSSANSFEYVSSWHTGLRKVSGMEDGSAYSGSLPRLDKVGCLSEVAEETGDSDLDCMYLNPDEIAAFVSDNSRTLDRTTSKKVHKRLDTVLNNTYLQIVRSSPPPAEQERARPGVLNVSLGVEKKSNASTPTPYVDMASVTTMWSHIKDRDETQSFSGFTSDDASSVDWDADKSENETLAETEEKDGQNGKSAVVNHYDEIPQWYKKKQQQQQEENGSNPPPPLPPLTDAMFDDCRYGSTSVPNGRGIYTDDIYAVIRDPPNPDTEHHNKSPPHTQTDTWPSTPKKRFWRPRVSNTPPPTRTKTPNTLPRGAVDEPPYMRVNEAYNGERESQEIQRPPPPPPRPQKKVSVIPPPKSGYQLGNQLHVPGIGPLPLYTTLRRGHHQLRLVPLSILSPNLSEDEHGLSDSEHPNDHLYSLGKFVPVESPDVDTPDKLVSETGFESTPSDQTVPKRRVTHHVGTPDLASLIDTDGSEEASSSQNPNGHKQLSPQRSHTFSVPSKSKTQYSHKYQLQQPVVEKSGFLNKMGPEKKRWTRRWFVLKGSELKYYRSKDHKRARGVINLDSWCKLTRIGTPEAFQLATPKRLYHLVAKNQPECEEWLKVLEAAMQHTTIEGADNPLKPKMPTVSGWAHITQNGQSEKLWCSLEGEMLNLAVKPGLEPHRKISVGQSTVRRKRDSILLDSGKQSRSNLNSMLFTIKEKISGGVTVISPENQEDKDSWYYHLSATQSGDQELNLTMSEKLLTQMMQDNSITHKSHPIWKHPLLNCTTGPLRNALTSLPSAGLIAGAKNLFQSLQLFLTTPLSPTALEYHICSLQHMVGTCLKHTPLIDELYCQLLRQISGHTNLSSTQVLQGWFLLYLIIPMFLPIKRKFAWYLKSFLERYASNSRQTISQFAKQCQQAVILAQERGPRQCKPSYFELTSLLSGFSQIPTVPVVTSLTIPVYLADCSIYEIHCTSSTTIEDFTSHLNTQIDMLDTTQTGFALMCDWPGMEDAACCCPFPDSKLCDVVSMWSSSLEELNYNHAHIQPKQQRNISFTYKRRLSFRQRCGQETEKEAILLAYQMSRDILNNRHPVSSVEEGVQLAAIMAQIEYGDWTTVAKENENSEAIEREALQRFCPWRFTHLALEHDQSLLQSKLVKLWKEISGRTKNQCAHDYLTICYKWEYYGATLFQAEERFCCDKPRRFVWLAIHEKGVSLLEHNTLSRLQTYSYEEITTFGGNNDGDFMLVVSPLSQQLHTTRVTGGLVQSEKLVFSMSKLKICEATFLIASYMKDFEGTENSKSP